MSDPTTYHHAVISGTRNHKGLFVQEVAYKLIGIDQSGWALICLDDMTCHYVDPDNLVEVEAVQESEALQEAVMLSALS